MVLDIYMTNPTTAQRGLSSPNYGRQPIDPPEIRNDQSGMPAGRPSNYTEEKACDICDHIADGGSLAAYCRKHDLSPSNVFRWLDKNPEFRIRYARARLDQADSDSDAINDLARRATLKPTDPDYVDPQGARVAIDALKWTAAKRNARLYGDKIAIEMPKAPPQSRDDQIKTLRDSGINLNEIIDVVTRPTPELLPDSIETAESVEVIDA